DIPKCSMVTHTITEMYKEETQMLKKALHQAKGWISFTTDMWSAMATLDGYMGITVHY
ncbi:hypothetical protein P691DRAFT_644610, partial [Macrolepiota fuliginosa MF-IS2]